MYIMNNPRHFSGVTVEGKILTSLLFCKEKAEATVFVWVGVRNGVFLTRIECSSGLNITSSEPEAQSPKLFVFNFKEYIYSFHHR